MEKHVTAVGVIRIGLGTLAILGVFFLILGGIIVAIDESDPVVPLVAIGAVTVFLGLLALANIVAGIGVLKYQPWARILTMVLAVLSLFNIPIGTIIGIYTLWALLQDETAQLFAGERGS